MNINWKTFETGLTVVFLLVESLLLIVEDKGHFFTVLLIHFFIFVILKGGVGHFGETSSSALESENTQPEKICHFLTEPLLQHTRTRT